MQNYSGEAGLQLSLIHIYTANAVEAVKAAKEMLNIA